MLRVVSDNARRDLARYRATAAPVSFGDGFYGEERDDVHLFRWMRLEGDLRLEAADKPRFLEIWVFSNFRDLTQELVAAGDDWQESRVLASGWSRLSVPVPAGDRSHSTCASTSPSPAATTRTTPRTLAIRVRQGAYVHGDGDRHQQIQALYANKIHNWQEMLAGKSHLDSTPPTLGIDMYGVCNVKPPCVYCEWDISKEMEGDNVDAPFTRETLEDWGGDFFPIPAPW